MKVLKTGDPCPCCGQPIKWKNPRILQLLTYAAEGELTHKGLAELLILMEAESEAAKQIPPAHAGGKKT